MSYLNYLILALLALLLITAAFDLPMRGAPQAPLHNRRSPVGSPGAGAYYIEHAREDAHTPNMVTVVLADYRGFDTLGETIVVFTAGMACALILRRAR